MADLLECLIQIKALEESIARLARLVGASAATDRPCVLALLARLVESERRYAIVRLVTRSATAPGRPRAEAHPGMDARRTSPTAVDSVEEFVALRRANLEGLRACTAADLASFVDWPGRTHTTVADLVAIMLSSDTDVLGQLSCHRAEILGQGSAGLCPGTSCRGDTAVTGDDA